MSETFVDQPKISRTKLVAPNLALNLAKLVREKEGMDALLIFGSSSNTT